MKTGSSRGSFSENIGYNNVRGYFLYIVRFMFGRKTEKLFPYIFLIIYRQNLCFERKT